MSENGNGGNGLFSAGAIIAFILGIVAFIVSAVKTVFSIQDLKEELKTQNDKIDTIQKDVSKVKETIESNTNETKKVFEDIKEHSKDIIGIGNKLVELSTRVELGEKYRHDINRGFKWLDESQEGGSARSDKKQKSRSKDVSQFQKEQQDNGDEANIIE